MQQSSRCALRGGGLLSGCTAIGAVAAHGTGPSVAAAWALIVGFETGSPPDRVVASGVVLLAAAGVAVVWLWAMVSLTACLAEEVRGTRSGEAVGSSLLRPRVTRLVVSAVMGSAVVSVPTAAGAADQPAPLPSGLQGLVLPDRVLGQGRAQVPEASPVHRVLAGDSLWAIAERLLPGSPSRAQIDRMWRQLYQANRRAVGPDPDLIHPGLGLRLPQPVQPPPPTTGERP